MEDGILELWLPSPVNLDILESLGPNQELVRNQDIGVDKVHGAMKVITYEVIIFLSTWKTIVNFFFVLIYLRNLGSLFSSQQLHF